MKSQDILVLLKLAAVGDGFWSYSGLAEAVSISVGEAHHCVERLQLAGLVQLRLRGPSAPKRRAVHASMNLAVARSAVAEFVVHGLRYVYPATYAGMSRGMPTASSAPAFAELLAAPGIPFVWPTATGEVRGQGVAPFHPSVPAAASTDAKLYRLLAIAELLRVGSARERAVASDELKKALKS